MMTVIISVRRNEDDDYNGIGDEQKKNSYISNEINNLVNYNWYVDCTILNQHFLMTSLCHGYMVSCCIVRVVWLKT